jgi:hypothetical protein
MFDPWASSRGNFARPLAASGVEIGIVPFQDGFRVNFNFNRPNVKVVGTGQFIIIGEINGQPLYLELIQPNPNFPAFQHCPKVATCRHRKSAERLDRLTRAPPRSVGLLHLSWL